MLSTAISLIPAKGKKNLYYLQISDCLLVLYDQAFQADNMLLTVESQMDLINLAFWRDRDRQTTILHDYVQGKETLVFPDNKRKSALTSNQGLSLVSPAEMKVKQYNCVRPAKYYNNKCEAWEIQSNIKSLLAFLFHIFKI